MGFLLKGCITYFGVQMSSTGMHFNQNPVNEKPLHYNVAVFLSGCLVLLNLDDRNMLLISLVLMQSILTAYNIIT